MVDLKQAQLELYNAGPNAEVQQHAEQRAHGAAVQALITVQHPARDH